MLNAALWKPEDQEGVVTSWKHDLGYSPANDCGKRKAVHSKRIGLLKRNSLAPFLETTKYWRKENKLSERGEQGMRA